MKARMKRLKGRLGKRLTTIARHEPAPQAVAREDRPASPEGVEVLEVDSTAERPAGTNQQFRGSQDGGNQNGLEDTEQAESPPLQPIEAIAFPRCYAAVRNTERSLWDLADAILAECSETGADGVRNGSEAKMKAMQEEIRNLGFYLSFERIRKLRKLASAFPPGRRQPGVCLDGHLEAGTPEALEQIIESAPVNSALTRKFIQQAKQPNETAEQDAQQKERRHQVDDQRKGLQGLCRQLEQRTELLLQLYTNECRSAGRDPEPLPPPASQAEGASPTVAEALEQSLRALLTSHGLDPAATPLKQAIRAFVTAVLERP